MGVEVTVLRPHVWRNQSYEAGATYIVESDGSQTEQEYLGTLKAFGLAEPIPAETPESQSAAKAGRKKSGAA